MEWIELIATLSWRGLRLTIEEFNQLVEFQGDWQRVESLSSKSLREFFEKQKNWIKDSERDWSWCQAQGLQVLYPRHPLYPPEFLALSHPPTALTLWGNPCWLGRQRLSVVGSRKPLAESLSWMDQDLAEFLKVFDCAVISGAARGVDQRAHGVSLRCRRPTLAFLPTGLGQVYPTEFMNWIPSILDGGGGVISQFAPKAQVFRSHFVERNQLIAALAPLLLVVQARRRSGTMLTAKYALQLHREVAALTHFPHGETLGGIDLIRDGAHLIRDSMDLLVACQAARF